MSKNNTDFKLWQLVHCGPLHVPKIDTHTLPFVYKLGLKRIPFPYVLYVTFGGTNGYSVLEKYRSNM